MRTHQPKTAYDSILDVLGLERSRQGGTINDSYMGEYQYFRHIFDPGSTTSKVSHRKYNSGRLEIFKDESDIPRFHHSSYDFLSPDGVLQTDPPEHEGLVLFSGDRLFLIGWRPRVLRLAITNRFDRAASDSHMEGMVLSARNKTRHPFSAKFVLVHESNFELLEQLSPDNPSGEAKFLEIVGDHETYLEAGYVPR